MQIKIERDYSYYSYAVPVPKGEVVFDVTARDTVGITVVDVNGDTATIRVSKKELRQLLELI